MQQAQPGRLLNLGGIKTRRVQKAGLQKSLLHFPPELFFLFLSLSWSAISAKSCPARMKMGSHPRDEKESFLL